MSLNNISLPPKLLAALYEHSLVESPARVVPQQPPVPFLGKGEKNILIVVNKSNAPFLPDGELDFLTKILTACGLGLSDVAIVNWSRLPHPDAEALQEQFSTKKIILFDAAPEPFGLPVGLTPYVIHTAKNGELVLAPALKEIEKAKEAKHQLWAALKQLFGL